MAATLNFTGSNLPNQTLIVATDAETTAVLPQGLHVKARCLGRRSDSTGASDGDYLVITTHGAMEADLTSGAKTILDSYRRDYCIICPNFIPAGADGDHEISMQAVGGPVEVCLEAIPRSWGVA